MIIDLNRDLDVHLYGLLQTKNQKASGSSAMP